MALPLEGFVPCAPDWRVDWAGMRAAYPWIDRLHGTPHDGRHHAEGDVGVHVRMVCEAMAALPEFRALSARDRTVAFVAAMLHDVAKPDTTVLEDDGAITSRGHSRRGAQDARLLLWRHGSMGFAEREQVCRLVLYHQWPFHAMEAEDCEYRIRFLASSTRLDLLSILAKADSIGRLTATVAPGSSLPGGPFILDNRERQRSIDNVELFRQMAGEMGCLHGAYVFPDKGTARLYFSSGGSRPADWPTGDAPKGRMVLLSGLPGSGKSTWAAGTGLPVVGLDEQRALMDVDPEDNQGTVVQALQESARVYLRASRDFVWNATNLGPLMRRKAIDLAEAYGFEVEVAYFEVSEREARRRNAGRYRTARDTGMVPDKAFEAMLLRWEPPLPSEAAAVRYFIDGIEADPLVVPDRESLLQTTNDLKGPSP
jgi:predicted kinase